jgi:hypothetical protein
MRLHRILTAAALAILASAPLVTSSPAFAQWGATSLGVHLPPMPGSMPQAPMFGGQQTTTQTSKPHQGQQTAQVPDQGEGNTSPSFVAPGVERNGAGQLERSW